MPRAASAAAIRLAPGGIDGAVIDHSCSSLCAGCDAVCSERDRFDGRGVRYDNNRHVARSGHFGRGNGCASAQIRKGRHLLAAPRINRERVSALEEIARHGCSHSAQTDEADFHFMCPGKRGRATITANCRTGGTR
jgi:hypothetical protein